MLHCRIMFLNTGQHNMKICKDIDCSRELTKAYARGLCNMHYQRFRKLHPQLLGPQQPHGMYKSSEYNIWQNIKCRCLNVNDKAYFRYGGRGVGLCDEWLDFEVFIKDMGRRPSPAHSIDRIDNNKGYSPDNCRWVLPHVQLFNRGMMRSNTSGVKGVRQLPTGRWIARIGENGQHKFLGTFDTKGKAVKARLVAERKRLQI